jgi:hypothetical protein
MRVFGRSECNLRVRIAARDQRSARRSAVGQRDPIDRVDDAAVDALDGGNHAPLQQRGKQRSDLVRVHIDEGPTAPPALRDDGEWQAVSSCGSCRCAYFGHSMPKTPAVKSAYTRPSTVDRKVVVQAFLYQIVSCHNARV